LTEDESPFSPISVLHYRYYRPDGQMPLPAEGGSEIQCVVGRDFTTFGKAQQPGLEDYADGVDTMEFLRGL
ncbi:MAG TPA: hypothetical protein VNU70_02320, partial [Puia sp.]|nr:hypothetical protein [Puia sp.]